MMFADDDLGIHPEVAGPAENLYDPPGRSGAAAAVVQKFCVNHRAVEFGNVRQTFPSAALLFFPTQQLFAQSRSQFFPRQQFDFVLHPRIVGNHHAAARGIAKQSHHRRMRATHDPDNAALRPSCARQTAKPRQSGDHRVPVHRVLDVIARNKNISVHIRQRYIRHHESVAILVKDQAALDFVARARLVLREAFGRRCRNALGRVPRGLWFARLPEEETPVGEFLDEPALL